jgi:hypothetical protein
MVSKAQTAVPQRMRAAVIDQPWEGEATMKPTCVGLNAYHQTPMTSVSGEQGDGKVAG